MTEQIEFAIEEQNPTGWRKFVAWITAFDEGMNYDPQAYTYSAIRRLNEGVVRLEARVVELERKI